MTDPAFRIDFREDGDGWEATVWHYSDHGPDLPYAKVWTRHLEGCIAQAQHYVLMASDDRAVLPLDDLMRKTLGA